jgi:hypothetical protein
MYSSFFQSSKKQFFQAPGRPACDPHVKGMGFASCRRAFGSSGAELVAIADLQRFTLDNRGQVE